jgi:hypothetical protein
MSLIILESSIESKTSLLASFGWYVGLESWHRDELIEVESGF